MGVKKGRRKGVKGASTTGKTEDAESEMNGWLKDAGKAGRISGWRDVASAQDDFEERREKVLLDDYGKGEDGDRSEELSEQEVFGLDESSDDDDSVHSSDERLLQELNNRFRTGTGAADDSNEEDELYHQGYDDDRLRSEGPGPADDEADEAWGNAKRAFYNADVTVAGSEDEEEAKLEEQEALRLQKKKLEMLQESDFLLDDFEDSFESKMASGAATVASSVSDPLASLTLDLLNSEAQVEIIRKDYSHMSAEELDSLAKSTIPEVLELMEEYRSYFTYIQSTRSLMEKDSSKLSHYDKLKYRITLAYLTHISFFFAVHLSQGSGKSHPVVNELCKLRDLLDQLESMSDVEEDEDTKDEEESEVEADETLRDDEEEVSLYGSESPDDVSEEYSEEEVSSSAPDALKISDAQVPDIQMQPLPKRRKSKKDHRASNDFGEAEDPSAVDLEDKAARKKSLKFHVTRIGQQIHKRQRAAVGVSGDLDLPYRDRFGKPIQPERHAPTDSQGSHESDVSTPGLDIMEELRRSIESVTGAAKDKSSQKLRTDSDKTSSSKKRKSKSTYDNSGDEDADAYYEKVKRAKEAKRAEREDMVTEMKEFEQAGRMITEESLADGEKRKASWKILANKGLTPHRKKENRNPRVKKRLRYEKAMKKLSSFRRVVVDKSAVGAYGGELTGIKANLTRSVKF